MFFVKTTRHTQRARAEQFLGEGIQWVEAARFPVGISQTGGKEGSCKTEGSGPPP
jgi:hypothetical protein